MIAVLVQSLNLSYNYYYHVFLFLGNKDTQ